MDFQKVDLDNENTWSPKILELLVEAGPKLCQYEAEAQAYQKRCENDVLARLYKPELDGSETRAEILKKLEDYLSECQLIGFHCTNLHIEEINDICANGMLPLSREFAGLRISRLQQNGSIPESIASNLLSKNLVNNDNGHRLGMIWFVFSRNVLTDFSGIYRLLRFWGGESIYGFYESDDSIAPLLKTIGKPCIIEVLIHFSDINATASIPKIFLSRYLKNRGISTENGYEFEGHVTKSIPANQIRNVITNSSPEFFKLTKMKDWPEDLRIRES